jgi:two-component system, NarL family, sensor histidine kinase UhpB
VEGARSAARPAGAPEAPSAGRPPVVRPRLRAEEGGSGAAAGEAGSRRVAERGDLSLFARVFLTNAAVLAVASAVLAFSPVTVSSPVALKEAVALIGGVTAMLVVNLFLLRRAFAPLVRLTGLMEDIDPLRPNRRVPVYGDDPEVVQLTRTFNTMLDRLEAERRDSVRRSLAAQEGERRRIAQELHDEIGQTLTAVVLQIERATRLASDGVREPLAEAREAVRDSLDDVRRIAQRLRPEALDDLGLPSALAALADRLAGQSGVRIARRIETDLPRLSPEVELVIYRVAQEALTNVLRHADARHVALELGHDDEGGIVLRVRDDGRGLGDAAPGGGVQGMRERALLVGARLWFRTRAEGGTDVCLEMPADQVRA